MTNLSQPSQAQPIPPMAIDEVYSYYMRLVTASDKKKAKDVKSDIAERLDDLFGEAMQAMEDSDDLGPWGPLERIQFYYGKPMTNDVALQYVAQGLIPEPFSWEQQNAQYPDDWERDFLDFQNLRIRARQGDFGPQIQQMEARYQG